MNRIFFLFYSYIYIKSDFFKRCTIRFGALSAALIVHGKVMGEENDSVEQAVAERRERLKALRAAQELLNKREEDSASQDGQEKSDNEDAEDNGEQEDNPSMKFRNYVPHDKQLQEAKVAPPTLAKFEDPVAAAPPPSEKEDPLLNIAPKKPNWDLKRDVQKRLEKLDRRTQKAMHKLMVEQEKQKEIAGEEGGEAMEF